MYTTFIDTIKKGFIFKFQSEPILIFSPGRINLIGEHTDYNDGFVFPAAKNIGIVTAFQKSKSNSSTTYAIHKNEVFEFSLNNIQLLPQTDW